MTDPIPRGAPRQRRTRVVAKTGPAERVQPPTKFAHLQGEALTEALLADTEEWDSARFALEAGRAIGRFRTWVSKRHAVDAGVLKTADHRTAPAPTGYYGQTPVWTAGVARAWMMDPDVNMMDERGVFIPSAVGGRMPGSKDIEPRKGPPARTREVGPAMLAEYLTLRAGGVSAPVAKQAMAERHGLTVRQVTRRLEVGRAMDREARAEKRARVKA